MNEPANKLDWEQIERVMGHALELPEEQRAAYLERQPPSIRSEVESLLAAYGRSSKFLGDETDAPPSAPPASRPMAVEAGTQLGSYRIEAAIGQGGMGVVYRALDTRLNRPVAVKFLFDDLANPAARRRFQREAQTASSLNHPHILTVHDAGDFEGRQYLVTEFVDGGTLKDWARLQKPNWRQIVELLVGVADGLATAHSAGILHRDIKPDNILVARNGYAKLADFGLAKLEERSTPDAVTQSIVSPDSRPGIILGTIAYMSPEQASGRPTDARSDIFSFGVVLYELVAGRRPFEGATDLELLQTIIHGAARPLGADVPLPLRMVIEKALEKDPAERYQSTRDLVVDLRRLIRQTGEAAVSETLRPLPASATLKTYRWTAAAAALILVTIAVAGAMLLFRRQQPAPQDLAYTQITNLTDSAVTPALSPDGRMLAFIRSDSWWLTRGEIYVKLLPHGDPVQITHDARPKYGLAFSPDGSRIAYTVAPGWDTSTVSPLGGEPRPLLTNAAGLTWLDERRVLFSEIRSGLHMGVVTATENRSEYRPIYFPQNVRGMVHLSYASPDRNWVLVVEMDPVWQPCRVVPMDGSSAGRQVGPQGKCIAAAWSPDGKWMYFGAEVEGNHHLWRQRFPQGEPEQITSGPMEAEGVAVAPDGRSLITSIGMRQSAVWIRDARGERAISSEGYVLPATQSGLFGTLPTFSRDGKSLFYLRRASPEAAIELWQTDLESGRSHNLAPGLSMLEYDVSDDGKEVVFSTQPRGKASQLWIATLDRSSPPKLIASSGETSPHFGPEGEILYRLSEGRTHYLARMKRDGSERSRVSSYPIGNVQTVSADRRWVVAISPFPDRMGGASMAVPVDGGPPMWAPDGKYLYVALERSVGKTVAIPIPPGETFPNLPASGIRSLDDAVVFPGSRVIDGWGISPGPDPSTFAYVKTTVHRNLFRIPLRDD
jgi:Tol biopolymer transport system component/predicted Ser/Thr protein kinase